MTRFTAFGIHLALSAAICTTLFLVILYYWFPNDLAKAGGLDGLKLVIGVDLILGPVLTLLVFKAGKKGLKLDLAVIGAIQLACLVAGISIVYNQRPVIQILLDDGVHLVPYSDVKRHQIDRSHLKSKLIFFDLPKDKSTWSSVRFASEFADAKPFYTRSDLYNPLEQTSNDQFLDRIKYIQTNLNKSPQTDITSENGHPCFWIPVMSQHINGQACFNKNIGVVKLSHQ